MRGLFSMLAIAMVLAAAAGLYALKHRVEARREAVAGLERQILRDREAIRVLRAEWAYLTNPDLLQERARRHLSLRPAAPEQIASSLARLPFRGRKLLADAPAKTGEVGEPPQPRLKPAAPPRPKNDALSHTLARRGNEADQNAGAESQESFTARIRAVLERMGGEG